MMVRALDNLLSWQYFGCPGGRDPSPWKGRARIVEGAVAAGGGLEGAGGVCGSRGRRVLGRSDVRTNLESRVRGEVRLWDAAGPSQRRETWEVIGGKPRTVTIP